MDVQQLTKSEPTWSGLRGTVLSGGYEVGEISEADAQRARFRIRVLGDWHANAFLDAYCLPENEAREQLAIWTAAQSLRHPNLSSPLACGDVDIDGVNTTYLVALTPDESLAGVLTIRAATSAECLELLASVRRALAYLHANGWVHGHLSPEQVLAFGDSIRISSAYIGQINARRPVELIHPNYTAPEASDENNTPASDVWCLGATLFEALTRETFSTEKAAKIADLPAPFDRLVARCLDPNAQTRCTLEEMDDIMAARPKAAAAFAAAAGANVAGARTGAVRNAGPGPVRPPKPAINETPAPPAVLTRVPSRREELDKRAPRLWLYAGAVVLAVCVLFWAAWPRHRQITRQGSAPGPTATAAPSTTTLSSRSTPPTPTHGTSSPRALSSSRSGAAPVAPNRSEHVAQPRTDLSRPVTQPPSIDHTVNGPIWRVVLFTYAREADANSKAQSINDKHPDLQASVFRPGANTGPYLVTVGGKMTRDDATRLRRRVLGLGFPHDSYIQNYKE